MALEATGGFRTRTPGGTAAEVSPTYGTQCRGLLPVGATVAGPVGAALPMRVRAASRQHFGSRTRDRPAFGAKKGPATAPIRKHIYSLKLPKNSGQQSAGVYFLPKPKLRVGARTRSSSTSAEPETTRSNARLRHLNQADFAGVGRVTWWPRPGRRLPHAGSRLPHIGK